MADRLETLRLSIDPLVTALAMGFKIPEMIASEVLPVKRISGLTAKIPDFTTDLDKMKIHETKRPLRSRPNRVEFTVAYTTVGLEDHAMESAIDVNEIDAAGVAGIDARAKAANTAKTAVLVRREYDTSVKLQATANYAAGHFSTCAGGSGWNQTTLEVSNVDPIDVMRPFQNVVKDKIGRRPNQLTIGDAAWEAFKANTKVKARCGVYYGGNPGAIGVTGVNDEVAKRLLKSELNIDKVLVGASTYVSGTTFTDLWLDCAILQYIDPSEDPIEGTPTHGYTLCRQFGTIDGQVVLGVAGTYAENGPWVEYAYYEEFYYIAVLMNTAAYLFDDIVK